MIICYETWTNARQKHIIVMLTLDVATRLGHLHVAVVLDTQAMVSHAQVNIIVFNLLIHRRYSHMHMLLYITIIDFYLLEILD